MEPHKIEVTRQQHEAMMALRDVIRLSKKPREEIKGPDVIAAAQEKHGDPHHFEELCMEADKFIEDQVKVLIAKLITDAELVVVK